MSGAARATARLHGRRVLLILCSAALYAASFPPFDAGALAAVALVPFLLALQGLGGIRAAAAGLLWGTATIWIIGYWVPVALATYWEQSAWFGIAFSMVGSVVFVGSYGAGFAWCASRILWRWRGPSRVALTAAAWVTWEMARGRLLTGDPWLLIGYAPAPYPLLIQIADVGGVYLVSFVVATVNAAIFECIAADRSSRSTRRAVALAAALVGTAVGYGWWRLSIVLPESPEVPVLVVQGKNDLGGQWQPEYYGRGLATYLDLSKAAAQRSHPQLIVWPESSLTFFLAQEPLYRKEVQRMLAETGADLVAGAPYRDDRDPLRPLYYNSAFHVTADGVTDRYDKVHLMPFGEYFPLRTIELLRRRFERVRTFTAASEPTLLETRLGPTAVVICFEAIFPELVRQQMASGAELLINLSNDAWLVGSAGPRQHLAMIGMRAVENRTWIVRATTTGISAFIDPYGRIVARSEAGVATTLDGTIVPMRIGTVYERVGDLFAHACLAATALALVRRRGAREEVRGSCRTRTSC